MAASQARPPVPRPDTARAGAQPPWASLPEGRRRGIGLEQVRAALTAWDGQPARGSPEGAVPAAVLVALFEEHAETRVILTRRSSRLRSHTGQVSFPGGRLDAGESALDAALREAAEEVGLDPVQVEVVGRLSPLTTASSATWMTPFVGTMDSRPALCPNPAEVERVFDVALADLMADGVYREERWSVDGEVDHPIHFFEVEGELIWGATAHVLHELLQAVTAGN